MRLADDGIWFTWGEPLSNTLAAFDPSKGVPDLAPLNDGPRREVTIKLSFDGANAHPRLEPYGRLATHVSYLLG